MGKKWFYSVTGATHFALGGGVSSGVINHRVDHHVTYRESAVGCNVQMHPHN